MSSVTINNGDSVKPLILESNPSPTNNWCTKGVLRAMHSVAKIPSRLVNAWRDSTILQKVFGATTTIYCTAATVYIIYLQAQENTDCDCLEELKFTKSIF
ncbi:MAG: hypothetical protein WBD50_02485 [Candidatus Rhabdochlamydia sp.]